MRLNSKGGITVSVTELATYRRCRRRWDLGSSNRQRLQAIIPHAALSLGTAIHYALEEWKKVPDVHPIEPYLAKCSEMLEEVRTTYREHMKFSISDAQMDDLNKSVLLGRQMLENYAAFWKSPVPRNLVMVSTEQTCIVDIPGTPHELKGRLDAILKDKHGQLYALDHKTYGQRPTDEALRTNDQFMGYAYILLRLDMGPVAGIAYDGLWKRAKPPQGKTMNDLFVRMTIPRPADEFDEYEDMLRAQLNEMASDPAIYKDRRDDWTCVKGCSFHELCMAMSRGENWKYILRTAYSERPDDPAELEEADEVAETK